MGFVNVTAGVRAIGYIERNPLPPGPVAFISHSGSVFSAVLRTRRHLGFTLVVSSGQELVTTAADYLDYALANEETRVVGLLLETLRTPERMRLALARAADLGVAVVALTVGDSTTGRAMVHAHSGALAGADGTWEALFEAHGVVRVGDLDEMADTLELFAGRRAAPSGSGIATVHDSGAERALVADVADAVGVPFAPISEVTRQRLAELIDPGLAPCNPLDVWGRGADTKELFEGCLRAMAEDGAVSAVALAVDLVEEYDGDESYPDAVTAAAAATDTPVVVLSNLGSAIDSAAATHAYAPLACRCSRAPAAACWRCGTCSTMPARVPRPAPPRRSTPTGGSGGGHGWPPDPCVAPRPSNSCASTVFRPSTAVRWIRQGRRWRPPRPSATRWSSRRTTRRSPTSPMWAGSSSGSSVRTGWPPPMRTWPGGSGRPSWWPRPLPRG